MLQIKYIVTQLKIIIYLYVRTRDDLGSSHRRPTDRPEFKIVYFPENYESSWEIIWSKTHLHQHFFSSTLFFQSPSPSSLALESLRGVSSAALDSYRADENDSRLLLVDYDDENFRLENRRLIFLTFSHFWPWRPVFCDF